MAPPGMGGMPGGFGGQQQQPPCMDDIVKLRTEVEKRGNAAQAVSKRRGSPDEACKALSGFVEANSRLVNFIKSNGRSCGIPPDVLPNLTKQHATYVQYRTSACNAAAQPRQAPGPTFSDVLGSPTLPDSTTTTRAGSTFDTLSGNALAR